MRNARMGMRIEPPSIQIYTNADTIYNCDSLDKDFPWCGIVTPGQEREVVSSMEFGVGGVSSLSVIAVTVQ